MQACLSAVLFVVGWIGATAYAAGEDGLPMSVELTWLPLEPKQGDVVSVWVSAPEKVVVERGEMLSRSLRFSPSQERPGTWSALFGIDLGQAPGEFELSVLMRALEGPATRSLAASIRILPQAFGEERLTLPDDKVHLSPESLARVKKENEKISSLWPRETPQRYWEGPFLVPVEGSPGSPFGLERWINGERRNSHSGMDIKAPEGRPVRAANHGRVVLLGDFFFGGKAVFLDHGQGVYTMYFHLSKIHVVEGQKVAKGEVIGLVGMTGRATGPHLHWGVRLGGARVDPASLVDRTQGDL